MKIILKIFLILVAIYLVIGIIYAIKESKTDNPDTGVKDFILNTITWPLWVTIDNTVKDLSSDDPLQ